MPSAASAGMSARVVPGAMVSSTTPKSASTLGSSRSSTRAGLEAPGTRTLASSSGTITTEDCTRMAFTVAEVPCRPSSCVS